MIIWNLLQYYYNVLFVFSFLPVNIKQNGEVITVGFLSIDILLAQLDRYHLQGKPLSMSVRNIPDCINITRKTYIKCDHCHSIGWDPELNAENKLSSSIHLPLLPVCRFHVSSCFMLMLPYILQHNVLHPKSVGQN